MLISKTRNVKLRASQLNWSYLVGVTYITASTHKTVVRTGCIRLLIDKMKLLEDNVDIQINSSKILGNLAVNGTSVSEVKPSQPNFFFSNFN